MIKRIYLQTEKDIIGGETTWCSDRINDDDEEYVRLSDLVAGGVVEVDSRDYKLVPVELIESELDEIAEAYPATEERKGMSIGIIIQRLHRAMIGAKP